LLFSERLAEGAVTFRRFSQTYANVLENFPIHKISYILSRLFVKVPRSVDSEGTFSIIESITLIGRVNLSEARALQQIWLG